MDNREKNGRAVNAGTVNMKSVIEKKVFSYIEEHSMLGTCDRVVVGVSGGADSVCLFLLLLEYAKKVPISLAVVHVNHGIRKEAVEDARFVEGLCREKGVPFFLVEEDVRDLASRMGYSEEDAGRRVRYNAFSQTAERLGGARIAVAHNSNDNAETMLFHLFRGSGLQGLSGIAPVRGEIIRPILCLERREVEAYLESISAEWCQDATNEGDDYRRNRIRHHILPYAESEVVSGAVGHMSRTAELLRETEEYLELQTQEALGKCVEVLTERSDREPLVFVDSRTEDEGSNLKIGCIPRRDGRSDIGESSMEAVCALGADSIAVGGGSGTEKCCESKTGGRSEGEGSGFRVEAACFRAVPVILQKRIILKLLNMLSPTGKDILAVHVMDTMELFEREGNRSVSLPFGIRARRQYGNVFLEREETCPGSMLSGRSGSVVGKAVEWKDRGADRNRNEGNWFAARGHGELPEAEEAMGDNQPSASTWKGQSVPVILREEIFQNPLVYDLGDWGKIEFMGIFIKKGQEVPQKQYTKWFDYDKIKECVEIRPRRQGDYLTIAGKAGSVMHKTLKDYMITEKIPRQVRDVVPLVAEGNHVIWLPGWRISQAYKVDEKTERILQVRLLRAGFCEDSETEEKNDGEH